MLMPRRSFPLANVPYVGSAAPGAIALGRYPDRQGQLAELRDNAETHILLFGPNGSGKATRVLIPNLLRMQDRSIFVIDPKGELAAVTAPQRREYGEVVIINPFNVVVDDFAGYDYLKSNGFNPMLALDPRPECKTFNSDAALLAEALIKTESDREPHFDDSARALVAAIIMHVAYVCWQTGKVPTLGTVRDLLGQSNAGLSVLLNEMLQSPIRGVRNKASQFQDSVGRSGSRGLDDEIRSIAGSARRQTEFIDDDPIADDLNVNGIDFRETKKRPVTVYLILPPDYLVRHSRWLRLIISSALNALMRPRRQGEPRVLFLMDEFPALGHVEIIETTWALVRGYGIQMMPVFQDLQQLRDIYKNRADSFMGMAGAIAFFPPGNDETTSKWISDRSGFITNPIYGMNVTRNTGRDFSTSTSRSVNTERIPRFSQHDLYGMRKGTLLVAFAGERELFKTYAPHYFNVDAYNKVAKKNPYAPVD